MCINDYALIFSLPNHYLLQYNIINIIHKNIEPYHNPYVIPIKYANFVDEKVRDSMT